MAQKTPPLHARGIYQLKAPWTAPSDTLYECIAIRNFSDFVDKGEDVLQTVYVPKGLTQTEYDADKAVGANIITLVSPNRPMIYVPDTYILAYPNMGNVAYNNVVLSVSLGAVPDYLDLVFLQDQISGVTSDTIGVTPEVKLHISPSSGVVTQVQHDASEVARLAAITNRTTDRAKLIAAQAQLDAYAVKVAALEQIIKDGGLIPP